MTSRTEQDSLGQLEIPAEAYYGIHTQRSLLNFPISQRRLLAQQIQALAAIKQACALANRALGYLSAAKTKAIVRACVEIREGQWHDQVCLDIYQAGSGTSSNMNINEVIANRAAVLLGGKCGERQLVHPNDDVNRGQSTNNVFPASIRVAAVLMLPGLYQAIQGGVKELRSKARRFKKILKSGRTHLQDAVPLTLGQAFGAHATALQKDLRRLRSCEPFLSTIGVGGNAVGTGLNTPPEFRPLLIKHLSEITDCRFQVPPDGIEATQYLTDLAHLSAILRLLASDLGKLASDLRLLSSGPRTGLNEIQLPPVEPGSSIMPGKINPSICEAVNMVCMQVFGNDQTVALAAAGGQLELNTHMPVLGYNLLESIDLLTNALKVLTTKCLHGITANTRQCRWYVENSPSLATALNPHIGYDRAADVVKTALATGQTIPEVVVSKGYLTQAEVREILAPERMTAPNLASPKQPRSPK